MGWKFNTFVFLFAVWSLLMGSLLIGIPLLLYLIYSHWSMRDRRPNVSGSQGAGPNRKWFAFLGLLLILLSFVAILNHGTFSPLRLWGRRSTVPCSCGLSGSDS